MAVAGRYEITLVLPRWTVVNELVMNEEADGILSGTVDTRNDKGGQSVFPIKWGYWNKEYFHIFVDVGLGAFECMGKVAGDSIAGVVEIDHTPDAMTGKRL